MMSFLQGNISPRRGYDGWALMVVGAVKPLHWTTCTTREEARALQKMLPDMFSKTVVVKVKIAVTEVSK